MPALDLAWPRQRASPTPFDFARKAAFLLIQSCLLHKAKGMFQLALHGPGMSCLWDRIRAVLGCDAQAAVGSSESRGPLLQGQAAFPEAKAHTGLHFSRPVVSLAALRKRHGGAFALLCNTYFPRHCYTGDRD